MKYNLFSKKGIRFVAIIAASATSILIIYNFLISQSSRQSALPTPVVDTSAPSAVSALGYLEPKGGVSSLSAPAFAEGARVDKLLVKLGDQVQPRQVVAILDSRNRLEAALKRSQKTAIVASTRLYQVKAGAKKGAINAQEAKIEGLRSERRGQINTQTATIKRLDAELQGEKQAQEVTIERLKAELYNAQTECSRYQGLYIEGAVTTSQRDSKCLEAKTAQERLNEAEVTLKRIVATRQEQIVEAKATLKRTMETLQEQVNEGKDTLNQIAEVRPVDVGVAQAELEEAQAAILQAQAELDLAYVRAPKAGQILKIHTWPGEIIGTKGIVDLGETKQMYAVAEIYESDLSQIRLGQRATITSAGFTGNLKGVVDEIGLQIGKKDVLGTDPTADIDARVVEVKISLRQADSERVAGLTKLQVKVIIGTSNY